MLREPDKDRVGQKREKKQTAAGHRVGREGKNLIKKGIKIYKVQKQFYEDKKQKRMRQREGGRGGGWVDGHA